MGLVLVLTTLVDAGLVAALVWLVRRADRSQAVGFAAQHAAMARFRGEVDELLANAERRTRALDHVLAMREATLRVLVQTSARPDEPSATPAASPAEVRLLRDLELSLEPAPAAERIAASGS